MSSSYSEDLKDLAISDSVQSRDLSNTRERQARIRNDIIALLRSNLIPDETKSDILLLCPGLKEEIK